MKISIIGTGYVGLPTGACFASFGNNVTCVDQIESKINTLNKGIIPFHEPGLSELVKNTHESGYLHFTTDLYNTIKSSDIILLAVGTPTDPETGQTDLQYIKSAAESISHALTKDDGYKVIAIKSTVPVGTGEMVYNLIKKSKPLLDFDTVSIPEFLREGNAISDFMKPDRVIFGVEDERAKKVLQELYSPFIMNNVPIVYCSKKSAEMIKYAANSFLGIKISYINELSDLCESLNADIRDVSQGIGLDKRIGHKFLSPGPGFGGSCFPKDMIEILTTSQHVKSKLSVVGAAIDYNLSRGKIMSDKIINILNKNKDLSNTTIGVLGLAFKANTDDVRMSPTIPILEKLLLQGLKVNAYDPEATDNMREIFPTINYTSNLYDCTKGVDAIVILTEWNEFKNLNFDKLSSNMSQKIIIDLRNLLNPKEVLKAGFSYHPIGFNVDNKQK